MSSKAFILVFLCVLFAASLLISSTAAEETSQDVKKTEETNGADTRCKYGCCGGYSKYGGCGKCCSDANEAQAFAAQTTSVPEKAEEETDQIGGGRCRYGCCGGYRKYGGCSKCCSNANEAQTFTAQTESMPEKEDAVKETDHYHYGDHCYYGCCGGWGYYGCKQCCKNAAEAADHETNEQIDDAKYGGGYGGGRGGGYGGGRGGGGGYGGGRGGGGGYGRGGGGRHRGGRCPGCSDAEEAGNTEMKAKP
ncbi:cold and drought-regulated protein CORA-like isoform X1 [Cornus florida]|uniref:cold and drought-regulated protein CORA-like isoform X1 n=1 Tax=Cornus florida TaxID=4283 RepID=UPI00289CABF0|nr:cold and drought-regulated protein CORA-like isoform X1 [Cornus florida]